jgi:hypothetical protein
MLRREYQSMYLVNEKYIGPSVPPPIPRLRPKLTFSKLDNFTRAILSEEANHGARARSSVQPYCELRRRVSRGNEPKEGISRVRPRYVDPTGVLLLGIEDRLASAIRRGLV